MAILRANAYITPPGWCEGLRAKPKEKKDNIKEEHQLANGSQIGDALQS